MIYIKQKEIPIILWSYDVFIWFSENISSNHEKLFFFSICAASYYNRRVDCILIRGWISHKLLGPKILQELLGVTAPTYTIDMQRESIRILLKLSTYTYVSFNIIVHGKIILKH